jgi:hypothetical protein
MVGLKEDCRSFAGVIWVEIKSVDGKVLIVRSL